MKIEVGTNCFCTPDCKYLDVDYTSIYGSEDVIRHIYCRNKEICENAVRLSSSNEAQEKLHYVVTKNEVLERRLKNLLQSRYIQSFDERDPFTGKRRNNVLDADSLTHFLKWKFKNKK